MKFLTLLLIVCSTTAFAELNVSPIYDGEFNMDGAGCWLEDGKSQMLFYSNTSGAKIKLNKKIVSLSPKEVNAKSATLVCGETYKFSSTDNSTMVDVNFSKGQTKLCKAKMVVTAFKSKKTLKNLKLNCAD